MGNVLSANDCNEEDEAERNGPQAETASSQSETSPKQETAAQEYHETTKDHNHATADFDQSTKTKSPNQKSDQKTKSSENLNENAQANTAAFINAEHKQQQQHNKLQHQKQKQQQQRKQQNQKQEQQQHNKQQHHKQKQQQQRKQEHQKQEQQQLNNQQRQQKQKSTLQEQRNVSNSECAGEGGAGSELTLQKVTAVSKLVDQGQEAVDTGDLDKAKQLALQAMVGAYEILDLFLEGNEEGIQAQQLGDWFGSCALILHQTWCYFPATKCFYTATVFDGDWKIQDHRKVSDKLWDAILNDELLQLNRGKVFETLDQVFAMAKLALKRKLYRLCVIICNELERVFRSLFMFYKTPRPGTYYPSPREAYHADMKPVTICHAEAQYKMGNYQAVKTLCAAVLKEMCDYDCSEAFEFWGLALFQEKEYEVAKLKIQLALKYTTDDKYKEHLKQLLGEIHTKLEAVERKEAKFDREWLDGTAAGKPEQMPKSKPVKFDVSTWDPDKTKHKWLHYYERYKDPEKPSPTTTDTVEVSQQQSLIAQSRTISQNKSYTVFLEEPRVKRVKDCRKSKNAGKTGKKKSNNGQKMAEEYRCGYVSSDGEFEENQHHSVRIDPPASESADFIEEETFYEQSRRIHANTKDCTTEPVEMAELLENGIELNVSYLHQFEDKHQSNYSRDPYYDEYLSEEELRNCLMTPQVYLRCELQIEGAHLAYCRPLDSFCTIETVEISGRSKTGQAFNGDEVVVQLLDNKHDQKNKRYGKVLGVLNRKRCRNIKHPVFMCTLDDMESHLMRPICKTLPKISVLNEEIWKTCPRLKRYKVEIYHYDEPSETLCDPKIVDVNLGELQKYVFLVAYINWSRRKIYPRGAVIKMLPFGESITTGLQLLNLQHLVPSLYNRSVVESVENKGLQHFEEIDAEYHTDRHDLTSLTVFTIDPPGSKDLDDALSVEPIQDGFKVGVHIADVSQFVEMDDPFDKEAAVRATTFYPSIYGRLPRNMLPEPLSNNACSLLPNKLRLTLSVFFCLDENGSLKHNCGPPIEFKKSFIRSCKRFTYREVQDIIEGKENNLKQQIMCLHKISYKIRKERLGLSMMAIDLENEDEVTVDSVSETFEAHYLVEEFMIMANRAVAQKLVRSFPKCVPLRCQPPPTEENMKRFIEKNNVIIDTFVKLQDKQICDYKKPSLDSLLGIAELQNTMSVIVPKHVWEKIKTCPRGIANIVCTDDLYPLQHLVHHHWITIQKPAEYKCSGSQQDSKMALHHYDLKMYPYTHFTSPIRRYIDIIVHRLLHAVLSKDTCPYSSSEVDRICYQVNTVTHRAKDYQKACRILKFAVELKKNPKLVSSFVDELSDRSLTLASPAMSNMLRDYKELPFNLLDMGFKPELVKEQSTNAEVLRATWKKRLYDFNGPANDLNGPSGDSTNRPKEFKLHRNPGVVFIPLQQWTRILKCAVECRTGDLLRAVANTTATTNRAGTVDDVSTECHNTISIQPNTTFSKHYNHGTVVKVQLMAAPLKGILTPRPMLYNMTNNVKLCLQHTDDPVLYLSKYSNRATVDQYRDTEEYLDRWIPLIHMEAATCAASNEESCVINNVPIRFENVQEGRGRITCTLAFCEIRNIAFSGSISENDDDDDVDESSEAYDWLCIRYLNSVSDISSTAQQVGPVIKPVWVGHAAVTSVMKMEETDKNPSGKVVIKFKLHDICPNLPPEATYRDSRFCVEVLRKSEVDRRTESFIKRMHEIPAYQDILAVKIAINRRIPPLDKLHLDMASTIERDMYVLPGQGPFTLPRNNKKQQDAVDKALKHRLTLIQGPPVLKTDGCLNQAEGTGKTFTGIKLMYLFDKINDMIHREMGKERRQILYCGPSNKSVDLVGRWMIQKLGRLCPKFVRVYGKSIEAIDYPIPGRTFFSKKSTRALKADEILQPVSLHHLIREPGKPFAGKINYYDRMFKEKNYSVAPDIVKEYVRLLSQASKEEIKLYNVMLCTTAVGSNPKILKASNVFQVIVDEAGMCPEPQCLMPIIATKAEQVVLIGDHKQLRPIIICKQAAELGLQTSLFERYAYSKHAVDVEFTMLNKQYRMNAELCRFPSEQFYDGKLYTAKSVARREDNLKSIWPTENGVSYPHVLIPIEGEEKSLTVSTEEGNEHSKSNMEEVEIVVKLYRYFMDNGVECKKINVISQYNAQCSEIRNRLQSEGYKNYIVSTVVSSQGGEWDYVIFSTVRSLPDYKIEKNPTIGWCRQNLGFITDQNQINVALTRARKGLIIVGNIKLLECDKVWRNLISLYRKNDCIKNPSEFPRKKTRLQLQEEADKRNWERYGKERFKPGVATSYEGDFDAEIDDDEEDDERFTKVRRGRHKMLRTRKSKQLKEHTENSVSYPHVLKPIEGEKKSLTTEKGNEHSKSNMKEVQIVRETMLHLHEKADKINWGRYGKEIYIPGVATSYEGDFDAEIDDDDVEEDDEELTNLNEKRKT